MQLRKAICSMRVMGGKAQGIRGMRTLRAERHVASRLYSMHNVMRLIGLVCSKHDPITSALDSVDSIDIDTFSFNKNIKQAN